MKTAVLSMFLMLIPHSFHGWHGQVQTPVPLIDSITVTDSDVDDPDCIYDPEYKVWFYIDVDDAIGASQVSCSAAFGQARQTNSPVRYPDTMTHLRYFNI